VGHFNLAACQLALERPQEARSTLERALQRNMDAPNLHIELYYTGFVQGDQQQMQEQVRWAITHPAQQDALLSAESDTEAYFGRLKKAREFSQQAVESARRADATETAALWQANAALREAEFGNTALARGYARAALQMVRGKDIRALAALAMARAGDAAQAQEPLNGLDREFPQNTITQAYWLPAGRAALELSRGDGAAAAETLKKATPYELGQSQPFYEGMMYPVYLRAHAYLVQHQGAEARREFQKLTLWKDADPDIPLLKQDEAEYAKLH